MAPHAALGPAGAALVAQVRDVLAAHGDPERAAGQQRYMKSAMPYHGVTSAELRRLVRPIIATEQLRLGSREQWEATVLALWDEATHREQRYAATLLAGHRLYRGWQDPQAMPLYEHLIRTGAWWDHVDDVASHHVGDVLARHPGSERARMRQWAASEDLWLRRAAIISQLGFGADLDTRLLRDVIEANLEGSRYGGEFFIRKAIGWALRQHARRDPDWVRTFVAEHEPRMSGLSRREALKHIG